MAYRFTRIATATAQQMGTSWMFAANLLLVLIWAAAGPVFRFSDSWQLWMNTFTTVVTYLAVFVIQNTQNRDAKAVHLKLDEIISSMEGARNRLVNLESLTDEEMQQLEEQFRRLHDKAEHGDIRPTGAVHEPDDAREERPYSQNPSRRHR